MALPQHIVRGRGGVLWTVLPGGIRPNADNLVTVRSPRGDAIVTDAAIAVQHGNADEWALDTAVTAGATSLIVTGVAEDLAIVPPYSPLFWLGGRAYPTGPATDETHPRELVRVQNVADGGSGTAILTLWSPLLYAHETDAPLFDALQLVIVPASGAAALWYGGHADWTYQLHDRDDADPDEVRLGRVITGRRGERGTVACRLRRRDAGAEIPALLDGLPRTEVLPRLRVDERLVGIAPHDGGVGAFGPLTLGQPHSILLLDALPIRHVVGLIRHVGPRR